MYSSCDGPNTVQVILPVTEIFTASLLIINRNRLDSSAVGSVVKTEGKEEEEMEVKNVSSGHVV